MRSLPARLAVLARSLLAYPVLAARYLFAGRHEVVVIGYLGLFDMLLLAPLARLRGKRVVWDAFLSVYDTYARDRAIKPEASWKANLLRWMERRACNLADRVVLDTRVHAALMGELHDVPPSRLESVLVGTEDSVFASAVPKLRADGEPVEVLFYGQFIPLHGIDSIIAAALDPRGSKFRWTIVGQGQEAARIDKYLASTAAPHIVRIPWVDYEKLANLIARADVCLGIFGTSEKAASVIPNKVFQALTASKPLITRDSAAIRELVEGETAGLYLVPPEDPSALLDALERFAVERRDLPPALHAGLREKFSFSSLTRQWRGVLQRAVAS